MPEFRQRRGKAERCTRETYRVVGLLDVDVVVALVDDRVDQVGKQCK